MRKPFHLAALFLLTNLTVFAQKDMKADIMAANQKFMDAFAKGATTMGACYTSDAQIFPPGMAAVQGNEAVGKFWKGAYDSGVKKAKLETMEALQNGDQVTEIGNYTLYGANDAQLDAGKYIVAWKKEGGQWKLHRDIWNTNTPASMASK